MTKDEVRELYDILYIEPVDRAEVRQFIHKVIDRVRKENVNSEVNTNEEQIKDKIEFTCQGDCECCEYADEEECGGVMLYGLNQICAELKPIKRDKVVATLTRFDYGDKGCKKCEYYLEEFCAQSSDELNYCTKYKRNFKDGECICKGKGWKPK